MPEVNTARGAIDVDDLGVTLMHEHVFIMTTEVMLNYPEPWGDDARREADAMELTDEQIHTMLVDNPRTIFDRRGGY
jgi:phosphotriesterase-related protein